MSQYADVWACLQRFEVATGSQTRPDKTKGLSLGKVTQLQEHDIPIQWMNDAGLKSLGVTFFDDPLQTTNYNWSKVKVKLEDFTNSTKIVNFL